MQCCISNLLQVNRDPNSTSYIHHETSVISQVTDQEIGGFNAHGLFIDFSTSLPSTTNHVKVAENQVHLCPITDSKI